MRLGWAKQFVLPILERWVTSVQWYVEWPLDEAIVECRWFKSEERAIQFALAIRGATVTKTLFNRGGARPLTQEEHEEIGSVVVFQPAIPHEPTPR